MTNRGGRIILKTQKMVLDKKEELFMKKMWISALLAAAMMTAAGAADAPSAWAQKSVDAARAAGLVPSQVHLCCHIYTGRNLR